MAPRKHNPDTRLSDDPRFQNIVAQAHEAGFGGGIPVVAETPENTPHMKAAPASIAQHSLQSDTTSYEGMTRVEKLFKAIDLGDAATIRDTIRAKYVPNKDGTESKALIESALSLVPESKSETHHFPEPLLHRAVRSQQMASVIELVNLGMKLPKQEQDKFFNATREIDGATVLHDLAASIPAKQKLHFTTSDFSKWSPDALMGLFVTSGTDVLAKSGGKTAADIAPNADVKTFLQTEIGKVLAEDEQNAMKWQARHARELREQAPDGGHLSRIR